MISPEAQKKLKILFLILILVAGVIFMVFVVFINKGKLIIEAKAPYLVNIENFKTINCLQDICEVTVAPKEYKLLIEKEGYEAVNRTTKVPLGGETKEQIIFKFVPSITEKGPWNPILLPEKAREFGKALLDIGLVNSFQVEPKNFILSDDTKNIKQLLFAPNGLSAVLDDGEKMMLYDLKPTDIVSSSTSTSPQIFNLEMKSDTKVFYDSTGKYLTFIDIDKQNFKQTLFAFNIDEKAKSTVTTFIRIIKDHLLISSPDFKKIALIDQTDAENSVYIIDLAEKTRTKIINKPLIKGLKWMEDGSGDFLLEVGNPDFVSTEIWWWDQGEKALKPLPLQANLNNIIPQNNQEIMAAVQGSFNAEIKEFLSANGRVVNSGFTFIRYNLKTGESATMNEVSDLDYPEKIEHATMPSQNAMNLNPGDSLSQEIFFLSKATIYSLKYGN